MTTLSGEDSSYTIMRNSALAVLYPEGYFQRFLDYNIRPDGRQLTELRSIQIRSTVLKLALGSSILAAERSRFVAGVFGEIGPPAPQTQTTGRIVVNVDFPKSCGVMDADVFSYISTQTAVILTQVLSSPEVIDLSQLCIQQGTAVWTLYVNIICLEYDGGSIDWSLGTAVTALLDTRLPSLIWCPKSCWWRVCTESANATDKLVVPEQIHWQGGQLKFRALPTSITVVRLFTKYWIVDPTAQEEALGCALTLWRAGPCGQTHLICQRSRQEPTETFHDMASTIAAACSPKTGCLHLMEVALNEARQNGHPAATADESWVMCFEDEDDVSEGEAITHP